MKVKFALRIAALVAAVLAGAPSALLAVGPSARAHEPVLSLDMVSTFPGSMPLLGDAARRLADKVRRASGGDIELTFHEPGVLVPGADTVNAVAAGRVAAAWAGAGWFAGADSAFNFFSSVPFGPDMGEYLAWMYRGGGLELAREMFHARGVHNIPCGLIPPEASGWFRKEIRSVEDLRGLRMRFFGLGALVMQKLGVETRQLPPGQILDALTNGDLDATEFSLPLMDRPLGFQNVTKFYYFPGWHQQATFFDLYVNENVWELLAPSQQAIIEIACGDTLLGMVADGEAEQWRVIQDLQAQGVQLRRWPPEILVAFESAWQEVVAEESARNPNFKRVYDSYTEFLRNYTIWRYLADL